MAYKNKELERTRIEIYTKNKEIYLEPLVECSGVAQIKMIGRALKYYYTQNPDKYKNLPQPPIEEDES